MSCNDQKVIIIGASLAAIATAAVCLPYFNHIVLIDRDQLGDESQRKQIPQAAHSHNLLKRGFDFFEKNLPGWRSHHLLSASPEIDWCQDVRFLGLLGWHVRAPSKFKTIGCSRSSLEIALRETLLHRAKNKIEIKDAVSVQGLILDVDRICGVRLTDANNQSHEIMADLVIDCSGRNSKLNQWFTELGLPTVEIEKINAGVRYSSVFIKPSLVQNQRLIYLMPTPPQQSFGGMAIQISQDTWIATLVSYFESDMPRDEESFRETAQTLRSQEMALLLQNSEFLDKPSHYGDASNRRIKMSACKNWPRQMLVLGDALICLNPLYGQGMSSIAVQAEKLKELLENNRGLKFGQREQLQIWQEADFAWSLAVSQDRRALSTKTKPKKSTRSFKKSLLSALLKGTTSDASLCSDYLSLMHLTEQVGPRFILRVLWHLLIAKVKSNGLKTQNSESAI